MAKEKSTENCANLEPGSLTREVVQRLEAGEVTGTVDTEVGVGIAILGLLQVVPPNVDVAGNQRAGNGLPVLAGILDTSDGQVLVVANSRPTGLSNVNGLALGNGEGLVVAVVEALIGVVDAVGQGLLPEGVAIEANPVDGINNSGVG